MGLQLNGCHVPMRSSYCANGFNEPSFQMLLCFLSTSPVCQGRYIQSVQFSSIITGAAPTKCCQLPNHPAQPILNLGNRLSTLVLWIVTFSLLPFPTGIITNNHPGLYPGNQHMRSNRRVKKSSHSCFVYNARAVYSMCIHLCVCVRVREREFMYVLHTHSNSGSSMQAETHQGFINITTSRLQRNMW